jgi:hypothetical protein
MHGLSRQDSMHSQRRRDERSRRGESWARAPKPKGTGLCFASDRRTGTADLTLLRSGVTSRVNFTSHRRKLGPLVVLAKKGLSRLLTPILERQTA